MLTILGVLSLSRRDSDLIFLLHLLPVHNNVNGAIIDVICKYLTYKIARMVSIFNRHSIHSSAYKMFKSIFCKMS